MSHSRSSATMTAYQHRSTSRSSSHASQPSRTTAGTSISQHGHLQYRRDVVPIMMRASRIDLAGTGSQFDHVGPTPDHRHHPAKIVIREPAKNSQVPLSSKSAQVPHRTEIIVYKALCRETVKLNDKVSIIKNSFQGQMLAALQQSKNKQKGRVQPTTSTGSNK